MVELSLSFNQVEGKFTITDKAAARIKQLMEMDGRVNQALEIRVTPGGCAGFSYAMGWAKLGSPGRDFEQNGAHVIIQEADLRMIDGSTLDYIEDLMGSKFDIKNPNATSTCGCGKSFS